MVPPAVVRIVAVAVPVCLAALVLVPGLAGAPRGPSPWAPMPHLREGAPLSSVARASGTERPSPAPSSASLGGPAPAVSPAIVNPPAHYTKEPAPMGIADFGVTGAKSGPRAYSYASPSFVGRAKVGSMSVTISGSSSKVTAFELNAVLLLQRGGTNYSYWVQNGLHLDGGSDEYTIGGAYVWNFSSSTARLTAGELKGNSSSVLVTDTYYFIPGCGGFAGQCSTLTLPATLTGRIAAGAADGLPYVDYQYNIGAGWITYDNVSFLHLNGSRVVGFLVDGFDPAPIGSTAFYDAEWVWVGAGGGSASIDHASNITMDLEFWNGHNYQAIPDAWDFGGDTGETASNVTESSVTGSGGAPAAHLVSGAGSVGVLYNQSTVGFLNLTVPTTGPATVVVDGAPVTFAGGWANLTLGAGSHSVALQNYTNATAEPTVTAGATTRLDLSGAGRLAFTETGLPAGTTWGVSVDGNLTTTVAPTLVYHLPNGTYTVSYANVPGYYRNGTDPSSATLPGTASVGISYRPFTYVVPFDESGLPAGTYWWVNVSGVLYPGTGTEINVSVPNGTTPFSVGASYAFVADPSNGSIEVVAGATAPLDIAFSPRLGYLVGLVVPARAAVTVDGFPADLVAGAFNVSVTPGIHEVAATLAGYDDLSENVTVTAGNVTSVNLTMQRSATQCCASGPTGSSGGGSGTPSIEIYVGIGVAAVVAVVAVALLLRRGGAG